MGLVRLLSGDDFGGEGTGFGGEVVGEVAGGEVFFEVGDGDFFVGLDGGAEAFFCGGVEVVTAEDFFGVGGAEVDEFLVEVGVVGAEFLDVDFVVGFFGPDDLVGGALAVFVADGADVGVVLFDESEVEFFEDVGEVAAVEGGFVGVGGTRVDAGEGGCEEGLGVEGCVGHGCVSLWVFFVVGAGQEGRYAGRCRRWGCGAVGVFFPARLGGVRDGSGSFRVRFGFPLPDEFACFSPELYVAGEEEEFFVTDADGGVCGADGAAEGAAVGVRAAAGDFFADEGEGGAAGGAAVGGAVVAEGVCHGGVL